MTEEEQHAEVIETVVERAAEKVAEAANATSAPDTWFVRLAVLGAVIVLVQLLGLVAVLQIRSDVRDNRRILRCSVTVTADPKLAQSPLRLAECLR